MSKKTKYLMKRIVLSLLWIALVSTGLVFAVRDDSLPKIISWSICIGLWLSSLTNYVVDLIVYFIQKRKLKNTVSELTEQEKEALLECVSLSVEVPGGSIVAEVIKDDEVPNEKTGISVKYIPDDEVEDKQEVYINYPIYGRLCVMADTSETTMFSYPKTLW